MTDGTGPEDLSDLSRLTESVAKWSTSHLVSDMVSREALYDRLLGEGRADEAGREAVRLVAVREELNARVPVRKKRWWWPW